MTNTRFYQDSYKALAVEESGDKASIPPVLIHGNSSCHEALWRQVTTELFKEYR